MKSRSREHRANKLPIGASRALSGLLRLVLCPRYLMATALTSL
jgi:hypothetical protein